MERQRVFAPPPEGAEITVRFTGDKVSLDWTTTEGMRDQLLAVAEEPGRAHLVLDFGNVENTSSAALAMLLTLNKKLVADGRSLILKNLSSHVYDVLEVTDLHRILRLRPARAEDQSPENLRDGCQAGVLVADDEDAIRRMLEVSLGTGGFKVWSALNGRHAIDLYRRHLNAIAMVLLDVRMPGLDGPQTLRGLQNVCPTVRCCFMTANPHPYTEESLLQMGAVRVFQKPFAFAEVMETLAQLAGRNPPSVKERWLNVGHEPSRCDVQVQPVVERHEADPPLL
jgi:anti-anti-sigma factor